MKWNDKRFADQLDAYIDLLADAEGKGARLPEAAVVDALRASADRIEPSPKFVEQLSTILHHHRAVHSSSTHTDTEQDHPTHDVSRSGLASSRRRQFPPHTRQERRRNEMYARLSSILGTATAIAALVALTVGLRFLVQSVPSTPVAPPDSYPTDTGESSVITSPVSGSTVAPPDFPEIDQTLFRLENLPFEIQVPGLYTVTSKRKAETRALETLEFEPRGDCSPICLNQITFYPRFDGPVHSIDSEQFFGSIGGVRYEIVLTSNGNDQLENSLIEQLQVTSHEPLWFSSQENLEAYLSEAQQNNIDPVQVKTTLEQTYWIRTEADWARTVEFFRGLVRNLEPFQMCDWHTVDLDGDGVMEWLVTLPEGSGPTMPNGRGDFLVVGHNGSIYRAAVNVPAPLVVSLSDLTGDQLPDVVIASFWYGANYAPGEYQVLSMHHGTLENIVQPLRPDESGIFIASEYWDTGQFDDVTGDGLSDISISLLPGGGAGGGIPRAETRVWSWDGDRISYVKTIYQADTRHRHHVLYNANDAFEALEAERATNLYQQVINDEALIDVELGAHDGEATYHSSRQFAAFRLTLLALQHNDLDLAQTWQQWLAETYPETPLTQAADVLLSEWEIEGNLAGACASVSAFLDPLDNPTGPLIDLGYNNPKLTSETVCPIW